MNTQSTNEHTTETQQDILNGQLNALETEDKSTSGRMVMIDPQEGTPFQIVTIEKEEGEEDEMSFVAVGHTRLTENDSYANCKYKIDNLDWELISQLIVYVAHKIAKEIVKEDKMTE